MRYRTTISAVLVLSSFFVLPVRSFCEVKISLRNGREMMADSCRETKDRLICEKMGGTFEFDKAEIIKTENITIERSTSTLDSPPDTPAPVLEREKPKAGENGRTDAKANADAKIGGLTPEQAKRIAEIEKKRSEFTIEREKLMQERQQLHEEVKAAGVIRSGSEKYGEIQKKISDLDARINTFNDQVNKLNEEMSVLSNEPRKKTP